MTDAEMRKLIERSLALTKFRDLTDAAEALLDASGTSDAALAATVRDLLPLVYFGLKGLNANLTKTKRRVGRPSRGEFGSIDCLRAFRCWKVAKQFNKPSLSIPKAIDVLRQIEDILVAEGVLSHSARCFPDIDQAGLEQSVKKGRRALGMNGRGWHSPFCEAVDAIPDEAPQAGRKELPPSAR